MNHTTRCVVAIALAGLLISASSRGDWPRFRGSNFDGISTETGLKTEWSAKPPVVWEREIGSAFSSFAAVGDRLYTCGMADKQQVLFCLSTKDGSIIWQRPFEKEYRNENGDGTRATPTVYDGRVYIQGAHGRLLCVNAENGDEIWSTQFDHKPTWGYSASVLVEGDLAIAVAGDDQGSLAAFDRKTGRPRWTCGHDPAGYASPYPFTFEGRRYVVGFTGKSAIIAELDTGRQVWSQSWETDWDVNAAMPIFYDGYLLITSGYSTGAGLFKLCKSGDGLKAESVWQSKILLNKFQSCVLYNGNLYVSDQKAFKCVDFLTGKERWSQARITHGPLTLAQGDLFLLTEDGELRIGPASPDGFSPTTTAQILDGRCWSVPVIHNGRLFARNLEHIVAIDLRK
jgi:outer membrane protein assembly factor BamB